MHGFVSPNATHQTACCALLVHGRSRSVSKRPCDLADVTVRRCIVCGVSMSFEVVLGSPESTRVEGSFAPRHEDFSASQNVQRISKVTVLVLVQSERLPVAVQSAQCFLGALQILNTKL